jgi:hypothetical protein
MSDSDVNRDRPHENGILLIAWILYLVSLVCPTATKGSQAHDVLGIAVLIAGWAVLFSGAGVWVLLAFMSWLTNFAFLMTWSINRQVQKTGSKTLLSILPISLFINLMADVLAPAGGFLDLYNSHGYYVWISSFAVASVALLVAGAHAKPAI